MSEGTVMTQQQATQEQGRTTEQSPKDLLVGPIDYLALEFPGARLEGDGLRALLELVDRGIIRILDLRVAVVEANGDVTAVEITDLDGDGTLDLAVFAGARSGLIADDDMAGIAELVEPGYAVGVLLYENTWAGPFVAAMRRAGAELIASDRIPALDVIAMLDELEASDQPT
jgi:hypothetical protein